MHTHTHTERESNTTKHIDRRAHTYMWREMERERQQNTSKIEIVSHKRHTNEERDVKRVEKGEKGREIHTLSHTEKFESQ